MDGKLTDGRRGNHRSDGFLITTGTGFDHGTDASPIHITELAPMIFDRLLGGATRSLTRVQQQLVKTGGR